MISELVSEDDEAGATLVFIYGPPAAGKLTVANALAERTGYKVFDNHASIDFAASVLTPFTKEHMELVHKIRLAVFEAAAASQVDLIFTFVYAHPVDDPYVQQFESFLEKAGGRVCFVQLRPDRDELERRVTSESRRQKRTILDVETLRGVFEKWDLDTPLHENDLSIDNTSMPAAEVAELIHKHYDL